MTTIKQNENSFLTFFSKQHDGKQVGISRGRKIQGIFFELGKRHFNSKTIRNLKIEATPR